MFEHFVSDDGVLFAGGLLSGLVLGVIALRAVRPAGAHSLSALASRIDSLEFTLLAVKGYCDAVGAAREVLRDVQRNAGEAIVRTTTAGTVRRWFRSRPEPSQIAQELADSLKTNIEAAIEIGDAIADIKDPGDAEELRTVARTVKRAGDRMSTAFWDRYGEAIRESDGPVRLKQCLEDFFDAVGTVKLKAAKLSSAPAFARLVELLKSVIALLEAARDLAQEVSKLRPAA